MPSPFVRGLVSVACWMAAGVGLPAGAPATPDALEAGCTTHALPGDLRIVRCALPVGQAGRTLRFSARFSGGHDDTRAALAARLQDAPLDCAEGSKTSLFGEDGDVSLHCRFAVPPSAGAHLEVEVTWSHAQYTGFALEPDGAIDAGPSTQGDPP